MTGTRKHKQKWNAYQVQIITKAMRNAWPYPKMGAFKPALEILCIDLDAQGLHQATRRPPRPLRPTFQRDSRCVLKCRRALLLFLFCFIHIVQSLLSICVKRKYVIENVQKYMGGARGPPCWRTYFRAFLSFTLFFGSKKLRQI